MGASFSLRVYQGTREYWSCWVQCLRYRRCYRVILRGYRKEVLALSYLVILGRLWEKTNRTISTLARQ